jgi:hypothetical protein
MGMTADGLRLSLLRESIKYGDIVRVCKILGVRAGVLFGEEQLPPPPAGSPHHPGFATPSFKGGEHDEIASSRRASRNDDELVTILKSQLKDKDRIIELLSKQG